MGLLSGMAVEEAVDMVSSVLPVLLMSDPCALQCMDMLEFL